MGLCHSASQRMSSIAVVAQVADVEGVALLDPEMDHPHKIGEIVMGIFIPIIMEGREPPAKGGDSLLIEEVEHKGDLRPAAEILNVMCVMAGATSLHSAQVPQLTQVWANLGNKPPFIIKIFIKAGVITRSQW